MRDPTASYSVDELIAACRERGVELTRERLHRWRKTGLMPTPELQSLGRGLGRSSSYPASAFPQALMIDELLKRSRDLDVVRWLLFLDGFPVSMRHLRAQLAEEVAGLVQEAEETRAASDTDDDVLAQRYLSELSADAQRRSREAPFQALRRLIGKDNVPPFLDLIRQMAAGSLTELTPEERGLVTRAIPIDPKDALSADSLAVMSGFLSPDAVERAFRAASDETILQCRTEVLAIAALLRQVVEMVPGLGPALALEIRRRPAWPPPLLLLVWLRNRDDPMLRGLLSAYAAFTMQNPFDTHGDSTSG